MKNIKIEKLFVFIAFIIGCLFIYIIPPFQSPDEDSHFKKAYSISKLEVYQTKDDGVVGLNIPNEMSEYINEKLNWSNDREKKYSYSDLYLDQVNGADFSSKKVVPVSTSEITPVAHMVPAFGIALSRLFAPIFISDGSPSTAYMLSFARFASLMFYLVVGYYAIKITPAFKKSMFAILLFPMSIFLGSMVTYDSILISCVLLSAAVILKLIYDDEFQFNKTVFVLLSILGYILLNIKIIYFPILFLLYFVPNEKFKERRKIKTYLQLLGIILLFTILLKIPNFITSVAGDKLVDKQTSYIFGHPFELIKIIINNSINQFKIQLYWMTGTFGLLDTYLPPLFVVLSLLNMLIIFTIDGIFEKIKINNSMKFVVVFYIMFAVFAMYAVMYQRWTPQVTGIVGGKDITGVQGRYYLPLLIGLPMLLSVSKIKKDKVPGVLHDYFDKGVLIIVTTLCVSIVVCLTRFWV